MQEVMDKILRERGMLLKDDASRERLVRLSRMFGLTHELSLEPTGHGLGRVVQGAPYPDGSMYTRYRSLREAYVDFSGDVNINWFGKRVTQLQGLVSFETALANILNRLLIRDFGATDYGWERIASSITAPRTSESTPARALPMCRTLPP